MAARAAEVTPNRYSVTTHRDAGGWRVTIVDAQGRDVSSRSCRDEAEARTYASTVRQHARWLSEEKFREYYRLDGGVRGAQEASADARAVAPRQGEA